jgi:hypothetical protein
MVKTQQGRIIYIGQCLSIGEISSPDADVQIGISHVSTLLLVAIPDGGENESEVITYGDETPPAT